jgi:hypothetical protein
MPANQAEASDTKESTEIKQPPPFIKTSYPVHLIDCPESEPNIFSSRPPDKPSDPGVTCTGKRSGKDESQAVEEEDFWIKELCLKLSDKRILEKGHWVNDRIIMPVFKILRLHPCTADLGDLQDGIPAVKYGFTKENRKHFVQIINVRGNHWITLSNIKSCVDEVRIYDSFVNLNQKGKEISYPVDVEPCVCRIASPLGFVNMVVTNVQQQKGGSACGLFAISNTIALCFGKDPLMLKWNQGMLGPTLMRLFVDRDFPSYLKSTSQHKDTPIRKFLYEWVCWVHCHCAMSDDGELMGKCKDPEWKCRNFIIREEETRKRKEDRQKEIDKCFSKLRQTARKYSEHDELVTLYNKLNQVAFSSQLPPGEDTVGFLNVQEYNKCTGETLSQPKLGMTYGLDELVFIVIFRDYKAEYQGEITR